MAFAGGTLGLRTATASGGFVFSGSSGLAAFAVAGAASGAVAGGAQYLASGGITLANGGSWQFNAQAFGESVGVGALLGAATSVAGYGLGKLAGSFLTSETIGPGKLPMQNSGGELIRGIDESGLLTKIGSYDDNGNLASRIDVFGSEHGGIPTPYVHPIGWTQSGIEVPGLTGGWTYDAGLPVRPPNSWEKLLIFMLS